MQAKWIKLDLYTSLIYITAIKLYYTLLFQFCRFTGTNCLTNIDDCESEPCRNGATCTDKINGYTCSCVPGFTGSDCESDIDECVTQPDICKNGGMHLLL